MKSSILGKLRVAVVATTLALTFSAAENLCVAQERSQNEVAVDGKATLSHLDRAVLNRLERDLIEPDSLNHDPLLIAQVGGLWCYTSYGPYPMFYEAPLGSACHVDVYFYPYVLEGIVGY